MMHLVTRPISDGLEVVYHLDPVKRDQFGSDYFTYQFSRIGVGVTLDEVNYSVVVGERTFVGDTGHTRMYVTLDERECDTATELFSALIALKDRYQCSHVFTGNTGGYLLENLKRVEGLTFYGARSDAACLELWPTFVRKALRAHVVDFAIPDDQHVQRDLESFLHAPTLDPDSLALKIQTRLVFPEELPNRLIRTAVRQARGPYCLALWYALHGLDASRPRRPKEDVERRVANPYTGY